MYQLVLAAALVSTAASPNHCFRRAHHCYAPTSCACYGCYAGYAGYAGYAPWGYGCHGCHVVQGYGCAGACYGYHGGCYGGWGVFAGDPWSGGCTGCYGCYGGYAGYGVPLPVDLLPGTPPAQKKDPFPPVNPDPEKKPQGEEVPAPKEKVKKKTGLDGKPDSSRATIRIEVPEGGKLFVDGRAIQAAAGIRTFQTPPLTAGQLYFYDIRVEVSRGGEIAQEERRIFIRPAQEVAVEFANLQTQRNQTARVPATPGPR